MVGVDVDPVLIEAAVQDHPGARWIVEDLAELDLPARGISERFGADRDYEFLVVLLRPV